MSQIQIIEKKVSGISIMGKSKRLYILLFYIILINNYDIQNISSILRFIVMVSVQQQHVRLYTAHNDVCLCTLYQKVTSGLHVPVVSIYYEQINFSKITIGEMCFTVFTTYNANSHSLKSFLVRKTLKRQILL